MPRFTLAALALSLVSLTVACDEDDDKTSLDGTLRADGYALFSVDNDRQQRDDIAVTVHNVDPQATYILIYSQRAPKNVGWFQFDPTTISRCGGDVGDHCRIPDDFGYMVDTVTAPAGATEITLRDQRCGCNADDGERDWTGHWAVMRIERTNRENPITFAVAPKKVDSFTNEPDIVQLQ